MTLFIKTRHENCNFEYKGRTLYIVVTVAEKIKEMDCQCQIISKVMFAVKHFFLNYNSLCYRV